VESVLGDGSLSVVYRATQLSSDTEVALKVLATPLHEIQSFRERFSREGRLQASIRHPHVVPVYEAGDDSGLLFIAMQIVDGPSLKELLQSGELDVWRALSLLTQVASALDAAHAQGLVHRDIKPQNILVARRDHAYLMDFGLGFEVDGAPLTLPGQTIGTIDYLPPEAAREERMTHMSDVYGLGCVLYECLTGQIPFPRPNVAATLFALLTEPPPRPSERRPELPQAIDGVIARGLAKDPTERPASASLLIAEAIDAMRGLDPTVA
jgi:serine/threonine-protein kinase